MKFHLNLSKSIFFLAILNAFSSAQAQTETVTTVTQPATVVTQPSSAVVVTQQPVVEKRVIVTTVPAPKETIVIPEGFINCFSVTAGWYQGTWVAQHNVCQYPNTPNGVAWVEGYWACTKYDISQGQCTNWEWKSAHWEKTLVVY
jgi:hypothetical protein